MIGQCGESYQRVMVIMTQELRWLTSGQTGALSAKALAASTVVPLPHKSTPACQSSVCMAGSRAQTAPRLSRPVTYKVRKQSPNAGASGCSKVQLWVNRDYFCRLFHSLLPFQDTSYQTLLALVWSTTSKLPWTSSISSGAIHRRGTQIWSAVTK